jgi:3',5'-cyclic AMP phosphodiesterase CpdA
MSKPNQFQFLHISDLHISNDETSDRAVVLDPLIERVRDDRKAGINPEIVIVSGDIANTGAEAEYEQAKVFFDDLLRCLDLPPEHLFMVPGNYDVVNSLLTRSLREGGS